MAINYAEQWKSCKKEFETLTGKKKPSETTLGVFRKSSHLEDDLKKVDKTYADLGTQNGKGKLSQSDMDAYDKAVAAYKKDFESYIKLLEKTLAQDKDADSVYSKAIVMLKKQLKAMFTTMDTMGRNYANELTNMTAQEKVIAVIVPGTRSGLKKMSAFVAKVAAQKTPETQVATFNTGIQTAARDITQNVKNAMSFQKKGMVQWQGKDLDGAVKVLTAWANDGRQLPIGSGEKEIKRELGALAQVVKSVKEWLEANS